jgi:ABC-type polar amino acid transport system ATPase subunit/SAM-dependent methyltransferase
MRINEIDHRRFKKDDGLEPLLMRDLRRIVLLAGPNGAGKSRILRRISSLSGMTRQNEVYANRLLAEIAEGPPYDIADVTYGAILGVRAEYTSEPFQVVLYVPSILKLGDSDGLSLSVQIQKSADARKLGMQHLREGALPYLRRILDAAWDSAHPAFKGDDDQRSKALQDYERIRKDILTSTGVYVDRDIQGRLTLNGRSFMEAKLSDGQLRLLLWVIALHAQGGQLNSSLLVFDEPENSLHPQALIEMLARIAQMNTAGQMWIATHSVSVIASMLRDFADDVSLYCVEAGKASFAGREPERVLRSLVGGEENVHTLKEFIDLPEILATSRFAGECLLPPSVIGDISRDDPQAKIAANVVFATDSSQSLRRVLDLGAGKGRILEGLGARLEDKVKDVVDYVAWDVDERSRLQCQAVINRYYGKSARRWFSERAALLEHWGKNTFDVVLMCNVLHEIDPSSWLGEFSSTGLISCVLREDGWLVIIEDYLMPKGEYAHPYGFIVLDTEALMALFGVSQVGDQFKVLHATGTYAGRIKGHQVSAALLERVTPEGKKMALQLANRNARDKVLELRRATSHSYRSGQAHAFWTQQYANTLLALE